MHDALLIEAPLEKIDEHVAELQACMREASRLVLGGVLELGSDAEVVRWPERYMDERGAVMWDTVVRLLGKAAQDRRAA